MFELEFDYETYTQRGHGRLLRENNTKLTSEDETANLDVHERIIFCHIRQMRKTPDQENESELREDMLLDDEDFKPKKQVKDKAKTQAKKEILTKKRRGRPPSNNALEKKRKLSETATKPRVEEKIDFAKILDSCRKIPRSTRLAGSERKA